ncbi:MAG: TrmH family RNA methyltransferase [Arachnia sp.]
MVTSDTTDAASRLSAGALRALRRLTQRKARLEAQRFLVEGRTAVREALNSGYARELVIGEDDRYAADLVAEAAVEVRIATKAQLAQLSDTVTPQEIIAVCQQPHYGWEALQDARIVVVCAQVRDPGNAGTIVRDADAFGADVVVFTGGSVDLYNPKTVRATMGSIFHVPIISGVELAEVMRHLRGSTITVFAADAAGEPLDALAQRGELDSPVAWLFGNEAWGLPAADAALADRLVAIPMWGAAESLNLSSAAAICLYQTACAQHRATN